MDIGGCARVRSAVGARRPSYDNVTIDCNDFKLDDGEDTIHP